MKSLTSLVAGAGRRAHSRLLGLALAPAHIHQSASSPALGGDIPTATTTTTTSTTASTPNTFRLVLFTLIALLWLGMTPYIMSSHGRVRESPSSSSSFPSAWREDVVDALDAEDEEQVDSEDSPQEPESQAMSSSSSAPEHQSYREIVKTTMATEEESSNCPTPKIRLKLGRVRKYPMQFIHIPKAGGTSVQDSLIRFAMKRGDVNYLLHDGGGPDYKPFTSVGEGGGRGSSGAGLLLGHRGFGFSSDLPYPDNLFTIVVLREPLSRVVSLFDYVVNTKDALPPTLREIRAIWKTTSLDQVVEWYAAAVSSPPGKGAASLHPATYATTTTSGSVEAITLSNRHFHRILRAQMQFLCGYDCVWFVTGDPREGRAASTPSLRLADEEVFERARENLIRRVDCVAVLHRMDELIPCLKYHVEWIPPNFSTFPHENKVKKEKKSVLSSSSSAILRTWLRDELALYKLADEISAKRRACFGKGGEIPVP